MGKVTLPVTHNFHAFNDHAGNADRAFFFDEGTREIEIPTITQPALDAALITYTADQANIDAAFVQSLVDRVLNQERDRLDNEKILKALAELLVDEFNVLRAIEGLPLRTFAQLRTAIRNKVI